MVLVLFRSKTTPAAGDDYAAMVEYAHWKVLGLRRDIVP
jgi:hypothetical protein